MSPTRLLGAAAAAALPLAAAACVFSASVLEPESSNGQGGAGGADTTSDTGSASSSSGGTGGAGSGAGSGTSSGAGGPVVCEPIHPGGGECEYLPGKQCGCKVNEKCGVINETTGESACGATGNLAAGQKCGNDTACAPNTWCDHFTGTCERICEDASDCVAGAKCVTAPKATGGLIPGLKICTSNCEPVTASPCGPGVTCAFDSSADVQGFDCFVSGLKKEAAACTASRDCDKGLLCLDGATADTCERWCTPIDTTFPTTMNNCTTAGKTKCIAFGTPFIRNGVEFGVCRP